APVAWKDSVIIPVAMFLLPPFQSVSKSFHLTDYDPLPAGRYRLTASGSVYAEFQLVSGMDITFTGFPKEFADFLFSLQWNNTVELLPENKPVYQRLISEPLALLFHGLAQTAVSVSDTLVTRPSKCVSTMYSDMRFSRNTPLKAYMYIRFREPCGEKDILGLYFDMGCDYYSYGIRIYKQSSAGMARVRAFAAAHEQAFARELAGMQALGLEIKGEAFARDHFPGTQNAALKALLNSRSFYIGRDRPVSEVVFSGALHAEICNAYEGLRGLYLLLKQALYGGEKFT
ncbi:MAG: DUF2461 domain-containing protein, partial [Oscillospiraceae bacterium]|nr:DUF2461 domain-containing protein [Oscillospiraceae bacterium]